MTAYYNEIDLNAAQWLRNLIASGHIAPGVVDTRSIEDVHPSDLREFTQCHFFAGIGVWSYALRRAGWSDDRPVWTGSCPCQPFSTAGEGSGFADERHLWPTFHHLIKERRPTVVLGEQVASKDIDPWIDLVHADLEAVGYAFGSVSFPAASVGAPHIRDRNYWVANAAVGGRGKERPNTGGITRGSGAQGQPAGPLSGGDARGVGNTPGCGCGQGGLHLTSDCPQGSKGEELELRDAGQAGGFWRDADWIACLDGKHRPVEPGTCPLAYGAPARVGRLRGYGNAINAEAARVFIESVMESV